MALDTTVEHVEGRVPVTVVALEGELDASNFQDLVATAQGLYGAGTRHLLLVAVRVRDDPRAADELRANAPDVRDPEHEGRTCVN